MRLISALMAATCLLVGLGIMFPAHLIWTPVGGLLVVGALNNSDVLACTLFLIAAALILAAAEFVIANSLLVGLYFLALIATAAAEVAYESLKKYLATRRSAQ